MSDLGFALTAFWFALRDLFAPPQDALNEAGIQPGAVVLDYGCGPGSYSLAAAALVGPTGRVYAADRNPLALQRVRQLAARKGLSHIHTIQTDCATGLADAQVDVALLYDTYHDLAAPERVLEELHRVLRPGGILSFSDHHMKTEQILADLAVTGLFRLERKGQKTYTFAKDLPEQAR